VTSPEIDEARFEATQRIVKVAALRPTPLDDDSCGTCLYYLEPENGLSFCWHAKLHVLVDARWWCHFWEMRDE
jgi:hypothetical protein